MSSQSCAETTRDLLPMSRTTPGGRAERRRRRRRRRTAHWDACFGERRFEAAAVGVSPRTAKRAVGASATAAAAAASSCAAAEPAHRSAHVSVNRLRINFLLRAVFEQNLNAHKPAVVDRCGAGAAEVALRRAARRRDVATQKLSARLCAVVRAAAAERYRLWRNQNRR